ncbi:chromatin-remodeling histone chaperone SPT6 [Sugiyamaella lignohabitans]|uniref:Transcription elongation factor Spt6 n=1 Tax=Sugiyamaella lignohabitans TaxID=796027 RepID=A0A170QYV0_9ASCO|nr:chromatin-remodeling histone chaperone SPT6 [Sugiyamaella lignohabitans]ANB15993.1 chromatin-remodeling histone chaperone SPT6 [Sugiyamaella lignohabitans]
MSDSKLRDHMDDDEDEIHASNRGHDEEGEDEGSGSDVGVGDNDDSSEEEEEDDEEEMERVRKGFIVDDDDEDEEENVEESSKKRRKKKRRRPTASVSSDEGNEAEDRERSSHANDDELDQDDLDLLLENTGGYRREQEKRFKRLKRAEGADEDSGRSSRRLTDIFSDEEEDRAEDDEDLGQTRSRLPADEFDDFIEEDEFSDEEARRQEEAEIRTGRPTKSSRGPAALSSQLTGIDEDKLGEIYEVFGDGEEYEWALEGEDDAVLSGGEENDYGGREGSGREKSGAPELKDVFEPSELSARLLTDEDNAIRIKDIPERYQLLRSVLKFDYNLGEEDFAAEQQWVADKLVAAKPLVFIAKPYLREPFIKAVHKVVEFVSRDHLEVPTIWTHRRDYLIYTHSTLKRENAYESSSSTTTTDNLLSLDDLWKIVHLDIEFHGLVEKKNSVDRLFKSLDVHDSAFESMFEQAKTLVEYQDLTDYLQFRYSSQIKDHISTTKFDEDNLNGNGTTTKRHSRFARFERIREGPIYSIVRAFSITADHLGENIMSDQRLFFSEDPPERPEELAEQTTKETESMTAEYILDSARSMAAEEIFYDPKVRKSIRDKFAQQAKVDIILTDKGSKKINDASPYIDFKYAINRGFDELRLKPDLYLRMLQAETEGLVIVRISYPDYKTTLFEKILTRFFMSDNVSDIAAAWNSNRRIVLKEASRKFVPLICRNIKEDLKTDCLRSLYFDLRKSFGEKLNQAPYKPPGYVAGTTARILAISPGMGDFSKDAVVAVLVDEEGQAVESVKFGNPRHVEFRQQFIDLVKRRTPDVIGIAGFTVNCSKLFQILQDIVKEEELVPGGDADEADNSLLQVVWVQDEVARLYQHSNRALTEFPDQATLGRYSIALARYLQSPLCEYAALGKEISAITIHPSQSLLPEELFQEAIDSVFVDYVNLVGLDVNEVVRNQYMANLLPYVSGLGPRKASGILQSIQSHGGQIANRAELVTAHITTKNIFFNCASFLRIAYDKRTLKNEDTEPLDATRIHPEDYDLARKMAADALELDEEDLVQLENTSGGVIAQLLSDDLEKLNELILEQYAEQLEEKYNRKKSHTLELIREELHNHFSEKRASLAALTEYQIFTMLTGETQQSLHNNMVVPVVIRRANDRGLTVQLSNGIEGEVDGPDMVDDTSISHPSKLFTFGLTIQAVILNIDYKNFTAKLSTRKKDIQSALDKAKWSKGRDNKKWNVAAEEADRRKIELKQEQEKRSSRIIKHPLFRLFNSKQAEEYLAPLQRGDLVIRPSSRGNDHIAITWKISEMLFQHLDVVELDKPNEYSLGRTLQVGKSRYSDLDELIIMHVQAMARKVDEMVASDKFQKGSRAEVEKWLTAYTDASANRSVYAFCFDHKHPGYFLLCFKTNRQTPVQTWNVKVIPNGFELMNNSYADVPSLSNGFKKIFMSRVAAGGTRR